MVTRLRRGSLYYLGQLNNIRINFKILNTFWTHFTRIEYNIVNSWFRIKCDTEFAKNYTKSLNKHVIACFLTHTHPDNFGGFPFLHGRMNALIYLLWKRNINEIRYNLNAPDSKILKFWHNIKSYNGLNYWNFFSD